MIKGVNLGGWFVLEKWMTPSLFEGLDAVDETTFCLELGEKAETRLKKHWETFITEDDFKWIREVGLNSVRIPIGHWIFGDVKPYVGAIEYLNRALEYAKKYDLKVLLDLHTAPGCQNGFDNGGIAGVMEWHQHQDNIDKTIEVLSRIAERYGNYPQLMGIELLNEPHWTVPMSIIKDFYIRAYEESRKFLPLDKVIVFHDGFRIDEWDTFARDHHFENVMLDTHMYQCFTKKDKERDIFAHLDQVRFKRKEALEKVNNAIPTFVGEWSLSLSDTSFGSVNKDYALRAYAATQLLMQEQAAGWYFWSYKIEAGVAPQWNFRESVNRGWLPANY